MRWMVRILSGLVMLALLAVGAVFLIPTDEVARLAARQVEAATGRAFSVQGPVKASVWPGLAVETGPVRLANADWASDAPMVEAAGLRIALDTMALIRGDIRIDGLDLIAPRLRLERHSDGRANWDLALATPESGSTSGETRGFSLSEARMSDGQVIFADAATGARYDLSGIDAVLRLPDPAAPAHLDLGGNLNGQTLRMALTASPAAALLSGAEASGKIELAIGGAALDFEGSFGHAPLLADGALHVDAADHGALAALMGTSLPDLPQGLGARTIRLDGRAVLSPDLRLVLRDAIAQLDDNRLRLSADLRTSGQRPMITAAITAETPLVLPASAEGSAADGAGSGGWSTAPIDLSALSAVDADVTFAAPSVQAAGMRLGALRGRLALADGRAAVTLSDMQAYEGRISGTMVANAAGRGSVRADLLVENLALQPMLHDLAGYERLTASANGRISVLSSAGSMSEMMNRLQGEGQLSLGKGELRGLDLLGMLRRLDVSYVGEGQKTIFDSISSSFSIAEGVLRADDLKLVAPYLQVVGTGTVGIGIRTLDYRLLPVALQKEDGTGGLSVPLKITGPWAKPRFQLDMEALAKPKLDAERARAEKKLAEKLGADTENGETLEDAAKRKLENELRRGLGKLFGGN